MVRSCVRACGRAGLLTDVPDEESDLHVEQSGLTPECLESGRWPNPDEWTLSDHGIVTSRFVANQPPPPPP